MQTLKNFKTISHIQKLVWELRQERFDLIDRIGSNSTPQNLEELRVLDQYMVILNARVEAHIYELAPNLRPIFSGEF